ncbi:hypothetical protein [Acinetobacter pollinis]|uniref:hypothetical protein n=1 Tax=Acinetobacter pollinis TaxID=2605270 RepID=UPI0018A2628F|nr:hypothetical protein [Acinetobacter pollinis]MBF7699058.1 hypothetical protein [Acinetobacter pollinis]
MKVNEIQNLITEFAHIFSFTIEYDEIERFYNLKLRLCKDLFDIKQPFLIVNFIGVTNLNLSDFDSQFNQILGLVIEDNINGWERVKYDVHQIEDDNLSFRCFDINAELTSPHNSSI